MATQARIFIYIISFILAVGQLLIGFIALVVYKPIAEHAEMYQSNNSSAATATMNYILFGFLFGIFLFLIAKRKISFRTGIFIFVPLLIANIVFFIYEPRIF